MAQRLSGRRNFCSCSSRTNLYGISNNLFNSYQNNFVGGRGILIICNLFVRVVDGKVCKAIIETSS
jgi:hypothetical protein